MEKGKMCLPKYSLPSSIYCSNVVNFAASIANVTDASECSAQSNASGITAGGNICARQWNQTQQQD